jgi:putative thioredoxin
VRPRSGWPSCCGATTRTGAGVDHDRTAPTPPLRPWRPAIELATATAATSPHCDHAWRRATPSASDHLALGRALAAEDDHEAAIEQLLLAVELGGETREPAREQLVRVFSLLGDQDPRVTAARPRLARALF